MRLYHQIKHLSAEHEIILVSLVDGTYQDSWREKLDDICHQIYTLPLDRIQSWAQCLSGLFTGMPLNVAYFYRPHWKVRIREIYEKEQPDLTFVQLIRMAPFALNLPGPKVIDYMDAFSLRTARRMASAGLLRPFWRWEMNKLMQFERQLASHFASRYIIAESDKMHLEKLGVDQLTLLYNGVDTMYFAPSLDHQPSYDVAFVGNMSYHPNIEAARFLVKKILPILKSKMPGIKVLIAGARPTASVKALSSNSVRVSGSMPDIRKAYRDAKVFVAPIFNGSGLQNKILEAMAMGKPCVTTPIVSEAIGAPQEMIYEANHAEDFTNIIIKLLDDNQLAKSIAEGGRAFVKREFNWSNCCAPLDQLLRSDLVFEPEIK